MSNYPNKGATGRFGRGAWKKPGFEKKSWGDDRGGERKMELHSAICKNCGKSCEVPFVPNGKKPVYCRDCFGEQGGGLVGDRKSRHEFSSSPRASHEKPKTDENLVRLFEAMNHKLERLILAVEKLSQK